MTDAVRTPEDRFQGLPGFDLQPRYREAGGLRLAHVDEGEGPPVVFLHGEPTWSFLWRKVIPPVRDAGFRCIAPDLAGFGRSDKPVDRSWYGYDRHTELVASLFAAFVERTEDLPVSLIVRRGYAGDPGDEVGAAYDAPFPGPAAKAGARRARRRRRRRYPVVRRIGRT